MQLMLGSSLLRVKPSPGSYLAKTEDKLNLSSLFEESYLESIT